MRKSKNYKKSFPRIIKINEIRSSKHVISVLFDNGENRLIDFNTLILQTWKSKKDSLEYKLLQPEIFKSVYLEEHTLHWKKLKFTYRLASELREGNYSIGSDILYELSTEDIERTVKIGELFRLWRTQCLLTQDEVAKRAGTSRTYITKLESGNTDVELNTLIRLVQAGLNKQLKFTLK